MPKKETKNSTPIPALRRLFANGWADFRRFFQKERRERLKRPLSLKLFIAVYAAIPFINYGAAAFAFDLFPPYPDIVFDRMEPLEIAMNALALFAGAGLLSSRKAGLLLCMAYTPVLLVYKAVSFVTEASVFNIAAVLEVFFCAASIIFLTSSDSYSPFMRKNQKERRGWRLHLRRPVRIAVNVNDERVFTKNLCDAGLYASWKECGYKAGKEVNVSFAVDKNSYESKGGITRVDPDGAAVAFRNFDIESRERLHRDLQKHEIKKEQRSSQKEEQ